jgi:hypothetical protein
MRLSVEVGPNATRFLAGETLLLETESTGASAPWLMLSAASRPRGTVRNLRLDGTPTIPRSVRLVEGDRLDGWLCGLFGESLPIRRQPGLRPMLARGAPDWSARHGEILGRRVEPPATAGPAQSRLAYFRPLLDREMINYEFFYESGLTLVHPALGRLAFLLEPDGVRLHWMANTHDLESFGLGPDNVAARGETPLPLKPGEWNTMLVRLEEERVVLALNGMRVYEHLLEPSDERLFGLYHDRHATEARVRNVVLAGGWPESVSLEQFTEGTSHRDTEAQRRDNLRPQ